MDQLLEENLASEQLEKDLAGSLLSPPRQSSNPIRIMFITGEASGDHHGATLVRAIREQRPRQKFEFFGAGGDEMRAAGVEIVKDIAELNLVGAEEFLGGFRRIWRAFYRLRDIAVERKPDLVIFIDYPDFNMRLAKKLKRLGFATLYYITPQVWAWRQHRVKALKRDFNRLLVILPFEKEFYERAGVPVEFVGHPLMDSIKPETSLEEFCEKYGLDKKRRIITLLPGSRRKEIKGNLPGIFAAVSKLGERDFQFVLPRASTVSMENLIDVAKQFGGRIEPATVHSGDRYHVISLDGCRVTVLRGDSQNAIKHATLAVAASGTVVLETGVIGTPMIIVYKISKLNWGLFRWMIKVDNFGLVNLIAGREIVPELIQKDFTGNRLFNLIIEMVGDKSRLDRMRMELQSVREKLGTGASGRAARAILETIDREESTGISKAPEDKDRRNAIVSA